jgi:hypothetical protein
MLMLMLIFATCAERVCDDSQERLQKCRQLARSRREAKFHGGLSIECVADLTAVRRGLCGKNFTKPQSQIFDYKIERKGRPDSINE